MRSKPRSARAMISRMNARRSSLSAIASRGGRRAPVPVHAVEHPEQRLTPGPALGDDLVRLGVERLEVTAALLAMELLLSPHVGRQRLHRALEAQPILTHHVAKLLGGEQVAPPHARIVPPRELHLQTRVLQVSYELLPPPATSRNAL